MAAKKKSKKKTRAYTHLEMLTADELQLLIECPYEEPSVIRPTEIEMARNLVGRKLLEFDPSTTSTCIARCTEAGMIQARPLSADHVQFLRDQLEKNYDKQPSRLSRHQERALWMRILAETALNGSRIASIALETAVFLPDT